MRPRNTSGDAKVAGKASRLRLVVRILLAAFFFIAGIAHFTNIASFAAIVPPALPYPELIVQVTGAMELIFAVGLLLPRWQRITGILLALYLLAVVPANIHMAMESIPLGDRVLSPVALWLRVALQFPLIALILWATKDPERVDRIVKPM